MLGGWHPWRPRGSQPGWEKRLDRRKFSRMGGRAPGYRLSPEHFQAVKRMLALIGHKNALYYCAQSANSISWALLVSSYTPAIDSITACLSHAPKKCTRLGNFQFDINSPYCEPKTNDAFPVTCVTWRFCREQSPRGFSAFARLSYFARPNKTAMLRRLLFQKYKLELTTGIHAHSQDNVAWKVNSHFLSLYRHCSNSLTLSNASELFWRWSSINHIQIDKEKENFVIACLRPSQAGIVKREIRHFHLVVVQWRQRNVQKGDVFLFLFVCFFYLVLPCQAIAFLTFLCKLDCSCWWHPKRFFDSSVVPSFLVRKVENESFPCMNKLGERTGKSGETIAVVYELTKRIQEKLFADWAQ